MDLIRWEYVEIDVRINCYRCRRLSDVEIGARYQMKALMMAATLLSVGCYPHGEEDPIIHIDSAETAGWTRYTNERTGASFAIQQAFMAIVFVAEDGEGQCADNGNRLPTLSEFETVSAVNNYGLEHVFYDEEWTKLDADYGIYNHTHRSFERLSSVPLDRIVVFRCSH